MENILNYGLTVVFLGATLFAGKKVLQQKHLISINCKYFNVSRIFIFVCLVVSLVLVFVEKSDVFNKIRTISMMALVLLLMCLRDGVGEEGFVSNGNLFPYSSISHYDIEETNKAIVVYVVTRDSVKRSSAENTIQFHFNKSHQEELTKLLEKCMPKKHKRIKKG